MRKKKTAFSCLGFIQLGFNSSSFLLFFFGKKFKILELVFSSRHILFELFVCVCVCVLLSSGSSSNEQK